MALIGPYSKIFRLLPQNDTFKKIAKYFASAQDKTDPINKRIMNSPVGTFRKEPLFDEIFALEQVFMTKHRSECFTESHLNYIDLQLVISGEEMMEYADIDSLTVKEQYSAEKDLIIYDDNADFSKFLMRSGTLAVYFPEDAHVGIAQYSEPALVHKTVIKLPVKYLL